MNLLEPYQPLYLKYRPQSLSDLVGQSSVTQTLKNAIEHDRISHAYLFTGPRGCGKTSSARILAKSINCDRGMTAVPCLKCTSCDEVRIGNSTSVIEIDAASNNSVDDARLLIERAPLVAQSGKHKLYIIDECHMLTQAAFNALLKTIEEPPAKVIFILATTEEHKVPQTIVSRCQRLMFRLVNQSELFAHLKKIADWEKIEIEDDAIELIARRSGGGLRDALGLLDQASLLAVPGKPVSVQELLTLLGAVHEDVLLQISNAVLEHDGRTALEATHTLMMEGREPAVLSLELAKHFLNLAKTSYLAAGKASRTETQSLILGSASYINGLIEQAPKFDRAELAQIVEQLDSLEQTCKRSSQPALNVEVALVALCHRQDILLLKDLSARVEQLELELRDGARPASQLQSRSPAAARTATQSHAKPPVEAAKPSPLPQLEPAANVPQVQPAAIVAQTQPAANVPQAQAASSAPQSAANAPQAQPAVSDPQQEPKTAADDAEEASESAMSSETPSIETIGIDEKQQAEPTSLGDTSDDHGFSVVTETEDDRQSTAQNAGFEQKFNNHVALEELWSNVMDELQRRSIPAFSLVSVHAFPLSMENDDLTVGVMVEHFQKSIERKAEQIKAACLAVVGRPVSVRVKLVDRKAPAALRPRAKEKKPQSGSDEAAEESEGGGGVATLTAPPVARPALPAREEQEPIPVLKRDDAELKGEPAIDSSENSRAEGAPIEEATADSGLINEAYKLFFGPGSRRILPS